VRKEVSVLDDILHYLEDITQPDSLGPEHTRLLQKIIDLEEPLRTCIPLSGWDRISEAHSELLLFECRESFSRGFRLGVRLMLAALE